MIIYLFLLSTIHFQSSLLSLLLSRNLKIGIRVVCAA